MGGSTNGRGTDSAELTAALAGDESVFTRLAERHRRELHVHCYRMLASFNDAEDLVQDTMLRAWGRRETFQGRSSLRAWLYGIATNACLDFLAEHPHRALVRDGNAEPPPPPESPPHVPWLQPYPDRLLDEPAAPAAAAPDATVAARETIGIAFLVTMQCLPAKQRAALILYDVLDWSAKDIAALLELSVASVNSALQRARATLEKQKPDLKPESKPDLDPDEQQRVLLERYVAATERGDAPALSALLRADVRFSMPPEPATYVGRDTVVGSWVQGGFGSASFGDFRCRLTRANGVPAVACYLRKPGESIFRAMALDVLQIEDGVIKEITTFPLGPMVRAFDLPPEL